MRYKMYTAFNSGTVNDIPVNGGPKFKYRVEGYCPASCKHGVVGCLGFSSQGYCRLQLLNLGRRLQDCTVNNYLQHNICSNSGVTTQSRTPRGTQASTEAFTANDLLYDLNDLEMTWLSLRPGAANGTTPTLHNSSKIDYIQITSHRQTTDAILPQKTTKVSYNAFVNDMGSPRQNVILTFTY